MYDLSPLYTQSTANCIPSASDMMRARALLISAFCLFVVSGTFHHLTSPLQANVLPIASASSIERRAESRKFDHDLLILHAVTACLAWALFFPVGSILLRLIDSKNAIWIHVTIQVFATLIYTLAVGTGIHLAKKYRVVSFKTMLDFNINRDLLLTHLRSWMYTTRSSVLSFSH